MSEASARKPDLEGLSLERLHELTTSRNATTRREAAAVIKARQRGEAAPAVAIRAELATTPHGTPRPQLTVQIAGQPHARAVYAEVYELAARLERALLHTAERWPVSMVLAPEAGAVYLELMHGTRAEAQRGMQLLQGLARSGAATARTERTPEDRAARRAERKRKDAEREARKAAAAGEAAQQIQLEPVVVAPPAPPAGAPAQPAAAIELMPPPKPNNTRAARRQWRQLAGEDARDLEEAALSVGREHLPEHAVAVLDGGHAAATEAYWLWLVAQHGEPAKE